MSREIDYGNLMHRAMRSLIREVLQDVADHGLPGEHHFFITFDTLHPDAEIADWLSDRYPGEMTVVMQHWYDNLSVDEDGFSVTLNFGDAPEPLYIPYDAIRTFVDPSVEFGLRFESPEEDEPETLRTIGDAPSDADDAGEPVDGPGRATPSGAEPAREKAGDDDAAPKRKDAEIVSLDRFRK
ncbi:SspB family protein [Poseidonocella sedimentorum]|uniref:Stringent starvation protein B n=1 Tax=Poseidonocella sedimentorum TaxID=871652 RepID=A0A1I6DHI6_9RHOB|nr:ClpXP protease specificity-enhancing factor SspB [Poseidonocella sedimentorum]SFR04857.1 hypothetical protein SAMN04515673_103259 [Poseidonocella sedimentorum]